MRLLQLVPHLSDSEIKERLSKNRETLAHSRWQIIYLIQVGKVTSAELVAPIVNLSVHSIYKIVEKYNLVGESSIVYKPKGGRRKAYLSLEEEKELFISLEDKASKGQIKTAGDIRLIVEKKVGRVISDDFLWDLFQRNGWKKKMPRPHHPKRSLEEQLEFKKNSPKVWSPLL
jgi:transposase